MARSGDALPPQEIETFAGLLEKAVRARRFAHLLPAGDEGGIRLLKFARQLETRAAKLAPEIKNLSG